LHILYAGKYCIYYTQVNYLTTENDEQQKLEKTTQMWARKVARETKSLADLHDKMNQLTNRTTQVCVMSCYHTGVVVSLGILKGN